MTNLESLRVTAPVSSSRWNFSNSGHHSAAGEHYGALNREGRVTDAAKSFRTAILTYLRSRATHNRMVAKLQTHRGALQVTSRHLTRSAQAGSPPGNDRGGNYCS